MRKWLLPPLLAGALQAAVIRGTVVENFTGQPLSRASVLLEPVPGSPGTRMTAHTNRFGFFEFAGEPAGMYLLQASRVFFVTAQYGQKRWNSSGMPLVVTESETAFVNMRLARFGSIAGTVVDENDVGQPEFEVAAYLNTSPPQLVAKATSDDKGAYRIYGLLPGEYTVRTVGKQLEETGYKPTFAKEAEEIGQARTVDVELEQQVNLINVRPLPGQLYSLAVDATPLDPMDMPVTLTLASDMGRQIVKAAAHTFTGLPRGDYEVSAEAPSDTPLLQANYQRISLGRDTAVSLPLRKISPIRLQFDGVPQQMAADGSLKVMARRKDLAGTYDPRILKGSSAILAAGRWEFALDPTDGYYAAGFSGPGPYRRTALAEGWNEATVTTNGGTVRFTLSSNVASLHGIVRDAGEPVTGAPVFLEPMDLDPARRVTGTYVAITGQHGQYRFASLAPGRYRLLSSFEYQMPDSKTMGNAGAREVQLDAHTDATRDLDLYVIR